MKYRAILPLVTFPDSNSAAALSNAVALADLLNACLHVAAFNVDIPPVSSPLSELLLDLQEKIRMAEQTSSLKGRQMLAEALKQSKAAELATTTEEVAAAPSLLIDAAVQRSRCFDFVFVGWEAENSTSRALAEAVIFGSGRPTILMPELYDIRKSRHVAIAWDGSRSAARAAGDAHPLLAQAEFVSILVASDEKPIPDEIGPQRLANELLKVSVPVEVVNIKTEDCPVSVSLQERALEVGATLMVMGGYGHSRLRELVLGGATRGVLSDLRLPILLSH